MLHFISKNNKDYNLNLVRPKADSAYAFGGMNEGELVYAFETKTIITSADLAILSLFWKLYQKNEITQMLTLAKDLNPTFPFLIPAINAHQDRLPTANHPGRPKATILRIIKELNTDKFGPVFKAFCQQEKIYGFGDLQVKRLFDKLINENKEGDRINILKG